MDYKNDNLDPNTGGIEMIVPPTSVSLGEKPRGNVYIPSNITPQKPRRWRLVKIIFIVWGVLAFAAAGYLVYGKFSPSPQQLLAEAWLNQQKIQSSHSKIELIYTDQNPEDPSQKITGSFILEVDQVSRSENSDFALNTTVKFSGYDIGLLDEENLEFSFAIKKIGLDYYYNFDIFDIFSSFLGAGTDPLEQTSSPVWIKATESELLEDSPETPQELQDIQSKLLKTFESLENKHPLEFSKIIENIETIGSEEVDGQAAVRIKGDVNEDELIEFLVSWVRTVINTLAEEELEVWPEEDEMEEFITELKKALEPWEVKRLEFLIGKKDHFLREILLETNAPSILSSFDSARGKSRDAKRLADARQIQTALELYYNDCARYPEALEGSANQGCPAGDTDLSHIIPTIPTAPTPAEGPCSEEKNNYTYNPSVNGQAYSLTFCLGESTGGFGPGVVEASQSGIKNLEDTGGAEVVPLDSMNEDEIPFNATFTVKVDTSQINQPIQIPIPENAIDMKDYEQNSIEYSTVDTIRSALESYYAQYGSYPRYLIDLTAEGSDSRWYLPELKPAQNTTGECSGINSYFNYGPTENNQNYHLEFCLIAPVYSLDRGKHSATKDNIDGKPDDESFFPFVLGEFLENLKLKNPLE